MDWSAIIGSIVGGLVGGLFTFLGVLLTIKHNDKITRQNRMKEAIENRPRLEIKDLSNYAADIDTEIVLVPIKGVKKGKVIPKFLFERKSNDNYENKKFAFYNIGKTEIESVSICAIDKEYTCLFEKNTMETYMKSGVLNYEERFHKRYIKPNEFVCFEISCKKTYRLKSVYVFLHDINGRIWKQYFDLNKNELNNSILVSFKEFKDHISIDEMLDRYKNYEEE